MDSSHWELESSPARAGLGLALGLSSLTAARHFQLLKLKRSERMPGYRYGQNACTMRLQRQKSVRQLRLLRAGVLGHSLGALRHCVLCQLSRQKEANCSLDFTRGDGRPVHRRQLDHLGTNVSYLLL